MSTGFLKSALLISGALVALFAAGCQNNTGSTSGTTIPNTSATTPPLSGTGGSNTTSTPTPTPGTTTSTPTPSPSVTSTVGLNLLSITVGGSSLCGGNLNQALRKRHDLHPGNHHLPDDYQPSRRYRKLRAQDFLIGDQCSSDSSHECIRHTRGGMRAIRNGKRLGPGHDGKRSGRE